MATNDRYQLGTPDLIKRIIALEDRISTLERVPQAGATTVDRGTFRAKDSTGSERVRMGLLTDGTYGIEVKEANQNTFHQVPFVFAQQIQAFEGLATTTFSRLTTTGPVVTVPVRSSGRIQITISTQIQWPANAFGTGTNEGGSCSFQATGANTIALATAINFLLCGKGWVWAIAGGNTFSDTQLCMVTHTAVLTGLTPGDTTFEVFYRSHSANTTEFGLRTLSIVAL